MPEYSSQELQDLSGCIQPLGFEGGWDVIGLDNINDYYSVDLKKRRIQEILKFNERLTNSFVFFQEDLNSDIWEKLAEYSFDAVVHLAAQAGVRYSLVNPRAYLESNILGFQSVIEFIEKQSIDRFIYASSSSVYGKSSKQPFNEIEPCNQPESYYAATKKSNELMAHAYYRTKGLSSIGLRFFTVYGPWGRPDMAPYLFVNAAYKGESIKVFNHGNQERDFTFIDDVVEGIYLSVKNANKITGAEVFNIGFGSPISLMNFITEIENATNCTLNKVFVEAQPGDVEVTYADTFKINAFSGYSPRVGLSEGISQFVKWFQTEILV